jgi:HEAT repeat protein
MTPRRIIRTLATLAVAAVSTNVRAQNTDQVSPSALTVPAGFGINIVRPSTVVRGDVVQDSLYRLGRQALERGDFRRAASLFLQVRSRDSKTPLAAESLYWHAFSMYRAGGARDLQSSLASLTQLVDEYPANLVPADAGDLRVRVCGALARLGDADCAGEVNRIAGRGSNGAIGASAGARISGSPSPSGRAGGTGRTGQQRSCPDEDSDERIEALNALLQMNSENALPILDRVLQRRDECSTVLRRKAVFLVSQKRDQRGIDMLVRAIKTDPDAEVREQAVFWLGQSGSDAAIGILQDILRTEKNEDLLDKAVFSLSQHRSAQAGTILRDLAQRDGAPVHLREQAIFWLGQRKGEDNVKMLMELYPRVNQEALKDKILFSVSQMNSAEGGRWLASVAGDSKETLEQRKQALFWLGQTRGSAGDLYQMYDRMTEPELKEHLIFVYSQRRDAEAVTKMIDILKTEKDTKLRSKAVFWLGQSRDPRAVKAIEDLLNR